MSANWVILKRIRLSVWKVSFCGSVWYCCPLNEIRKVTFVSSEKCFSGEQIALLDDSNCPTVVWCTPSVNSNLHNKGELEKSDGNPVPVITYDCLPK